MTVEEFAGAMLSYVCRYRGSVTSWIRSPERNGDVGGVKYSYHLLGLAADVVYEPNPKPLLADARRTAAQVGLKVIRESDHDHLQPL